MASIDRLRKETSTTSAAMPILKPEASSALERTPPTANTDEKSSAQPY